MKASFRLVFFLLFLFGTLPFALSQIPTQVIIANGGVGGASNMVEIGAWNLANGNYTVFDSFAAGSVQNVFVWGRDAYVSADSILVRYNLDTYQREAMTTIYGVRKVAVWEDKVLITKGIGSTTNHLEVCYAENLHQTFAMPEVPGNCEGVLIVGDTGYVANPVYFSNPTGNMAVVDMRNRNVNRQMSLDTMGKNIDNLYYHNGKVVSISIIKYNNPLWGFISQYDIANGTFTHHRLSIPVSQGAGIHNGLLYANFGGNLGSFNLATGMLSNLSIIPGTWSAMVLDSINDRFYLTESDNATYGKIWSYDLNGTKLDSANVGISPRAIAIDYGIIAATPPVQGQACEIVAFPQPFMNQLHIDLRALKSAAKSLAIYDLAGLKLYEQDVMANGILEISTVDLPAGAYFLKVQTQKDIATIKVIKSL